MRAVMGQQLPSARVYAASILLDKDGNAWNIGDGGWALRNGVRTNGHSTAIDNSTGEILVKSPRDSHWYKWRGNNLWTDMGATDPATPPPVLQRMTITGVVPTPTDWITVAATP
jgi:hypothetical protein